DERERIRELLLSGRPDLSRRLQTGPSGALLIPLPAGGGIEIGRMRRRGRARSVVVARRGGRTRVRAPATLAAVAEPALAALSRRLRRAPRGALLTPLPAGGATEVGRLRRGGRARWVVVARRGGRTRVREPATLAAVAEAALAALAGHDHAPAPQPIGFRAAC